MLPYMQKKIPNQLVPRSNEYIFWTEKENKTLVFALDQNQYR